jgi:histidyl-tRNA synthetase
MLQTIKGTRDILPGELPLWKRVETVSMEALRRYGFSEIRTPILEKTELFTRGIGESTDIVHKEMYTFVDRNEDSVSLRPEATASVVRAYIQHRMYAEKAPGELTRLYYIGPMFRRERPQAGRFRQFYQVGAEVLGESDDPMIEAEVIEMLVGMLGDLEITGTELLVNSVGDAASRRPYIEKLRTAAGEVLDRLCPDCQRRYATNPLRIFDCKVPGCQSIIAALPTITESLDEPSRAHFERFREHLDARGIAYTVNPRMVRGLDYYSKTAFEITGSSLGAQNTLVGGGRYDGLAEALGGPPTKGFGFAFGLDRMVLSMSEAEAERARNRENPDIFLVHLGEAARAHSAGLAAQLRKAGLSVIFDFTERKMKKAMSMASEARARFALIVGENEIESGRYALKNLQTAEQQALTVDAIINQVKEVK